MKRMCTTIATALAAALQGAVPVAWTNTPATPQPYLLKPVPHGVPVDFRVTLKGYTSPLIAPGADLHLWYQTNGMGKLWWPAPATLDGDTITASFGPAQDTGADRVSLFFGAPSNVFAAAVLRLTHSPGFAPNALPPPEQATFEETDPVFAAWLAATDLVHEEQDPTVPAWAKAETPPQTMTTNDVRSIVTNEVPTGFTEWVAEPGDPSYTYDSVSVTPDGDGWDVVVYASTSEGSYVKDWFDFPDAGPDATRLDTPYFSVFRQIIGYRNALGLARLIDLSQLTNGIPDAAARAVYDVHDLIWDATENILYWHKIRQGHDEYIAVTNIDLTNPVNAAALKAWREANR